MARKGLMYRILPISGLWNDRDVSDVVNGIMNGKINATGVLEMTATNQVLTDERISPTSVILFTARANAEFGLPFVQKKDKGWATVGYSGTTPVTFDYVVLG